MAAAKRRSSPLQVLGRMRLAREQGIDRKQPAVLVHHNRQLGSSSLRIAATRVPRPFELVMMIVPYHPRSNVT